MKDAERGELPGASLPGEKSIKHDKYTRPMRSRKDRVWRPGDGPREQAVSLDANEPMAHYVLGRIYLYSGENEMAIGQMQTAIAINPNFALGHHGLGVAYHLGAGLAERA